jgi:putative cardiolipin synthase
MVHRDASARPDTPTTRPAHPRGRPLRGWRWPRLLSLAGVALLAGCTTLRTDYVRTPSSALPVNLDTPSARYVQAQLDRHSGQSGFRLLESSTDALMSRLWIIDQAKHSVDLQYFIFENDATGRLVAQRLLAAADRGVRIRLLLDDVNIRHEDRLLGALNAHPHIEVRVFNAFRTRDPSAPSKLVQFALEGRRLNRRMHNKSMIVDGCVAVIGGRNIGDPYFDAGSDNNFRDLDLLTIGPVVGDASRAFDDYWNSNVAWPLDAYRTTRDDRANLSALRPELLGAVRSFAQSDYAQAVMQELPNGATGDRPGRWQWGEATLLVDQPQKVQSDHDQPALRIGPRVKQAIDGAQSELLLISPYFVPSHHGARYLTGLARRGVTVKTLTNSLASTDEPAVEGAYARTRRELLEGGVQLYELQPGAAPQRPTAAGRSSGTSLHAKAVVIDRHLVFVGSMNLDPRSKLLNTEMGVLVDCPELAAQVARFFEQATDPRSAFHVQLDGASASGDEGHLTWSWDDHGHSMTARRDPEVSGSRKLEFDVLRLLPIQGLL